MEAALETAMQATPLATEQAMIAAMEAALEAAMQATPLSTVGHAWHVT